MPTKTLYTTSATATGGGREGTSRVDDGSFTAKLTTPKELGGAGGDGVNPEQLFATGYAACFLGALRFYAGVDKAVAEDLIAGGHKVCPYSHATKGSLTITPELA